MIIDIHGALNTTGVNSYTESSLSNLGYKSDIQYKKIMLESLVVMIQYEDSLVNEVLSHNGVTIMVLGRIFLKNKPYDSHFSVLQRIVDLYLEKGISFLKEVKGTFILILIDERFNKQLIINDKLALYDLLYYKRGNELFFSTNIAAFRKLFNLELTADPISVFQYFLFDSPLSDNTLISGVKSILPGNYIEINENSVRVEKYDSYRSELLNRDKISWDETLMIIPEYFNKAVDTLIENETRICVGLTSGFDSRTNLSRLINHKGKEILYYSWGLPGSIEINIASEISTKLGLDYNAIFLTEDFEEKYEYFAHQSVMLSNGKGTITRANHGYGYQILGSHSNFFFTGLMGSELLKPRNCGGYMFTQLFIDLLSLKSNNIRSDLLKTEIQKLSFIQKNLVEKYLDEFIEDTLSYFSEFDLINEFHLRLYYYMLKDGFRNYFGHEIHTNRIYGTIISPYTDDDFIKFILSSQVPDLNRYAFKNSLSSKLKGTKLYLPILKANSPDLLKIRTGRYFRPKDLESPFLNVFLIVSYLNSKIRPKDVTFNTKKWSATLIKRNLDVLSSTDYIFQSSNVDGYPYNINNKLYSIKYLLSKII